MYIEMHLVMLLLDSACAAFDCCISCICRRIDLAPLAANIALMSLLLIGGLFIDPSDMPAIIRRVQYTKPCNAATTTSCACLGDR